MPIYSAILKYGYQNFSLSILEYCDINSLIEREKHFFNIFSPEYNILKIPGNPSKGSGWKHSEAALENMRLAASKKSKSLAYRSSQSKAQPSGLWIEATDLKTNSKTTYHAIRAAGTALGIDKRYIENYLNMNQDKPVLGRYVFNYLKKENNDEVKELKFITQKTSIKLEVTKIETNEKLVFSSIGSAAKALKLRQSSLSVYLKSKRTKPFKGLYLSLWEEKYYK